MIYYRCPFGQHMYPSFFHEYRQASFIHTMFSLIKELRSIRAVSMASLARSVNINRSTLFRYENGEKKLSDEVVVKIMVKLGLSKNVVYKIFVLHELVRLRTSFGRDDSVDLQIDEMLGFFDDVAIGKIDEIFSTDGLTDEEKKRFINSIYCFFKQQL